MAEQRCDHRCCNCNDKGCDACAKIEPKQRTVQCPSCKARLDEGADFEVVIPYRAASSNHLVRLSDEGRLVIGMGDAGQPTRFGRPELACSACGYQWATTREWQSEGGY